MPRRLRCSVVVCAVAASCIAGARAQTTSASLKGRVVAPDHSPVPAALVQARSEASGAVRTASAGDDGSFRFDLLAPGSWSLVARSPEGVLSDTKTIALRLQQTGEVELIVGTGLEDEVTVHADVPLIDPHRTGGEIRIQGTQADDLPIAGRDIVDLALLDSSVRQAAQSSYYGERNPPFVVNGQTGRANSYLVDGLDNNDQASGTSLNATFSDLVVSEFVLMTHQFSPEFGRASGGVLNLVTERGTNQLEGQGFLQGTTRGMSASGELVNSLPDTPGVPEQSSNYAVGLRWSGPIRKDKSFWLAAYEHQDESGITPYTGYTENPATSPDTWWYTPTRVVGGRYEAPNKDDNAFFRTDFNLDPANTLMVRLSYDGRTTSGLNVGGVTTPAFGFALEEKDFQLGASLTTVISPSLLHEMRVLLGNSSLLQHANDESSGVERPSAQFGGNNLSRQDRDTRNFQLVQNLTWIKGHHTAKFGYDVTPSWTKVKARFNPNGNFIYQTDHPFQPGDCYDGTVNSGLVVSDLPLHCTGDKTVNCFVAGDSCQNNLGTCAPDYEVSVPCGGDANPGDPPNTSALPWTYPKVFELISGAPDATLNDTEISAFAQDTWQATPALLLDYGLRYDLDTFTLPDSAIVHSTVENGGAGRDSNNLAPRFGFTYTAGKNREWVVRGGAGVFYNKTILAFPAVASITSGTTIGLAFPQGFLYEKYNERYIAQYGIDAVQFTTPDNLILRFSTGTRLDSTQANLFNLGFDRAFGKHGLFTANATRSLTYHVPLMKDLNPVASTDPQGIPIHQYDQVNVGSIAAVVTEGRAWYTGLDLGWKWQSGFGWYSVSYTLSKAEDMGPDPLKGGIYLPPNSNDLSSERGPSDNDRRHRFVVAGDVGLYLAGLRLSGVYQFATAIPFNVTTGIDDNVDGITSDRPPGVGRNTGVDTPLAAIDDYRAAHRHPEDPVLPPVTSLSAPYLSQFDLRLYRPFTFKGGKGHGQAFLQVFNVFNRYNGGLVEGRVLAANFGQVISNAGPPRSFELGFKMGF